MSEIMLVVNRYIGGESGYLGDFSYRSHREFYPEYCDLSIDPETIQGTTRARFISILERAPVIDQSRILRGVIARFPLGQPGAPASRTAELRADIERIATRLQGGAAVASPSPRESSAVVDRAIADADALLKSTGATSGVDRLHTALHGHLLAICESAGLAVIDGTAEQRAPSLSQLYRLVREQHPAFRPTGPRADDIGKILKAFSAVLDALQPVRNQASVAHPNRELLAAPEAMLVINACRTLLHYLDSRLSTFGAAR